MKISNFALDWLSFTYNDVSSVDLLSDFWKLFPEFEQYKQDFVLISGKFYSHGLCLDDDFTILYDDDNNGKGVNVQIPSHGLQHFFSLFGIDNVKEMFQLLVDRGCTPSRIDVCCDDYSKKYSPRYYLRKYDSGDMVTRMRMINFYVDPVTGGETFAIGSRRKKMVRVYDKNLESGGSIDAIRYEIEMHGNAAKAFFNHVIDSDFQDLVYFGDILTDCFEIRKKKETNANKSNWENNKIWFDFIKSTFSISSVSIPTYKPEEIIERTEHYIEVNNYSSFAYMIAAHGLKNVLKAVSEKGLTTKYQRLLRLKAEKLGLPPDYFIVGSLLNK